MGVGWDSCDPTLRKVREGWGIQVSGWVTKAKEGWSTRNIRDQDDFFHPHPARKGGTVAVRLKDLSPGEYRRTIDRIGYYSNDPYSRNSEVGSPTDLSREAVAELNDLSSGNRSPKPPSS
jgi:hypothetical protein